MPFIKGIREFFGRVTAEPPRAVVDDAHAAPTPVSVTPPEASGFVSRPAGYGMGSHPRLGATAAPGTSRAPVTLGHSTTGAQLSAHSAGVPPWKEYHVPRPYRPLLLTWIRQHGLDAPDTTPVTPEQKTALDHVARRQQALMDDAARDFPHRQAAARKRAMPDIPHDASADDIIRALYKTSDGLVVGEDHANPVTLKFLIDNMPSLAKVGVKTLYAEGFPADLEGGYLKRFFSSKNALMPQAMKRAYPVGETSLLSHKYSPTNLLYTARAYGIEVIPIDLLAAQMGWRGAPHPSVTHAMHERGIMMNQYAQTVINARQADSHAGKWVAWMGNAHVNTFDGIPGVAELTGAIGMNVTEAPPGAPSRIEKIVHADAAKPDTPQETDYSLTMPMA
ncbi:membrane-targeted effector domain-containing toxin [Dyella sp.]|uniref:membrane-targeted effector domain-containing toxin n=1 Tax=Dyella sp. TaxID=1869338 RepID=UPI002D80DD62|nr:membrane-targeted effector domain-containing toxin [Dyella sp.]